MKHDNNKAKEIIFIAREAFKNLVMGNKTLTKLRTNLFSGRTTGALDIKKAYKHSLAIYQQYETGLKDAQLPADYFKGKQIVEIGPGANLGVEVCFICNGAKKAIAIDRFPDIQSTSKEKELYTWIFNNYNKDVNFIRNVVPLEKETPEFNHHLIRYYGECGLEQAAQRLRREYDVAVSHLALEHVADLDQGIQSLVQILKPGGICIFICNLISLGGVYNYKKEPLRLLDYSERMWNLMFSNRGGSNRARAPHYKGLLEKNNFQILSFNVLEEMPQEDLLRIRKHFHSQFKKLSDEELSILKFRVVARLND